MKSSGGIGASSVTVSAAAGGIVRLRHQAIAERSIADLIVILQKVDECRR